MHGNQWQNVGHDHQQEQERHVPLTPPPRDTYERHPEERSEGSTRDPRVSGRQNVKRCWSQHYTTHYTTCDMLEVRARTTLEHVGVSTSVQSRAGANVSRDTARYGMGQTYPGIQRATVCTLRACVSCVGDACVHACVHAGCMRTVLIQLPVLSQLTGRESAIVSWIEILRGEFREFRGLKFCGAGGGAVFIAGDGPP